MNFGTEPHIITPRDGIDTSEEAAYSVDTEKGERLAYQIVLEHGLDGCILDELKAEYRKRAGLDSQFVNRRTGLHQKGLVLRQHLTRRGTSGKRQYVYVAKELLLPEWIQWMKDNYGWLNPCLFGAGETVPVDPMKAKNLIRELANDLALSIHALMQEGGCITENIGKPIADEDSALGRACAYLKRAIPLVPDYAEEMEEI